MENNKINFEMKNNKIDCVVKNNKINYEPWANSHNPGRFHRTDPTGRWSPIVEPEKDWPIWHLVIAGICFMMLFVLSLTGGW